MSEVRTLSVVKTDIRGFTESVGQMRPADLDEFLLSYRAMVLPVVTRHGGTVVKEIGDSFLVTFPSSTGALSACIELQRELAAGQARRFAGARIETRIAVSAGDVLIQGGDIFGEPVNLAARLEAITPANEIYFTEAVYQNLNRNEITCEPVGVFELKGIGYGVRVYRTTFQHQTRSVRAAVMFTDLIGFTRFAESAPIDEVEVVLREWEDAHIAAAKANNGTLQHIIGDANVLTFDATPDAFAAWLQIHDRVKSLNDAGTVTFPMAFGAGLAVGEIRIFRSALYGRPANHAAWMSGRMTAGGMLCPAGLVAGLPAEISARIVVTPAPPELRQAITRRSVDPAEGAPATPGDTISDDLVFMVPRP